MRIINTPKFIELEITNRCNLRCRHCYYFTGSSETEKELPKEEWIQFFEELRRCSVVNVKIQGGEPFIRKDIGEIIAGIVRNQMRFSILTNGSLLSEEMAAYLASTGRCNRIQISIDGSLPLLHDAVRGKGSFEKAVNAIKLLKKYDLPVTARVTVFKTNIDDLENIARLLLEELGIQYFSTDSVNRLGMCNMSKNTLLLNTEDRVRAMEILLGLENKYGSRLRAGSGPLVEAKMFMKMEQNRQENKRGEGKHLSSCSGAFNFLAVRADGVIVPCIFLGDIELGRINRDNIKDIWKNHPALNKLRGRNKIPMDSFEFCRGCAYINYCGSFCPVAGYIDFKNINHPGVEGCLKRFLEDGGRIPALK